MNDPHQPAYAQTVRLVALPPTDQKSATLNPNPTNVWLIFPRDWLTQTLEPLCAQRHLPKGKFLAAMKTALIEAGTLFTQEVPYVALRMTAAQDGSSHALGLPQSLDWTVAEAVAEAMHTAALDDVPADIFQNVCSWSLPTLIEMLKLQAREHVQDAAEEAVYAAGLKPRPSPDEILVSVSRINDGLAPLPPEEYKLLQAVLKAATLKARPRGLNAHQMFCEGRIDLLIPLAKALLDFQKLPPARQDAARFWLAAALNWGCYYIPLDYAPFWARTRSEPDDTGT